MLQVLKPDDVTCVLSFSKAHQDTYHDACPSIPPMILNPVRADAVQETTTAASYRNPRIAVRCRPNLKTRRIRNITCQSNQRRQKKISRTNGHGSFRTGTKTKDTTNTSRSRMSLCERPCVPKKRQSAHRGRSSACMLTYTHDAHNTLSLESVLLFSHFRL